MSKVVYGSCACDARLRQNPDVIPLDPLPSRSIPRTTPALATGRRGAHGRAGLKLMDPLGSDNSHGSRIGVTHRFLKFCST